jgi:hypothetical protein
MNIKRILFYKFTFIITSSCLMASEINEEYITGKIQFRNYSGSYSAKVKIMEGYDENFFESIKYKKFVVPKGGNYSLELIYKPALDKNFYSLPLRIKFFDEARNVLDVKDILISADYIDEEDPIPLIPNLQLD